MDSTLRLVRTRRYPASGPGGGAVRWMCPFTHTVTCTLSSGGPASGAFTSYPRVLSHQTPPQASDVTIPDGTRVSSVVGGHHYPRHERSTRGAWPIAGTGKSGPTSPPAADSTSDNGQSPCRRTCWICESARDTRIVSCAYGYGPRAAGQARRSARAGGAQEAALPRRRASVGQIVAFVIGLVIVGFRVRGAQVRDYGDVFSAIRTLTPLESWSLFALMVFNLYTYWLANQAGLIGMTDLVSWRWKPKIPQRSLTPSRGGCAHDRHDRRDPWPRGGSRPARSRCSSA